jgi:hypothetical protein
VYYIPSDGIGKCIASAQTRRAGTVPPTEDPRR